MATDWMWCYENPREAAAEIDRLLVVTDAQVSVAVDAYDAVRCRANGEDQATRGMSARNKESIAPMIRAAIEAARNTK